MPANVTVYAQPSLGSESYSGGNFQFTINSSAGVSVEVKASVDLVNWMSLGTLTLLLAEVIIIRIPERVRLGMRFCRVQENGVCSVNTIGFVTLTVPAKNPDNTSAFIAMANQLNNPAGNGVDVLFPDFPKQSQVLTWDADNGSYFTAQKVGTPPVWPSIPVLDPPEGAALVHAGGTTPLPEVLVGDVPQEGVTKFKMEKCENWAFLQTFRNRDLGLCKVQRHLPGHELAQWIDRFTSLVVRALCPEQCNGIGQQAR